MDRLSRLRVIQTNMDLQQALSAFTFMIDEYAPDEGIGRIERRRCKCFRDACAIYYGKPFRKARGLPLFKFELINLTLTSDEEELHSFLTEYRDKVAAHPDLEKVRWILSSFEVKFDKFQTHRIPYFDFAEDMPFWAKASEIEKWLRKLTREISLFIYHGIKADPLSWKLKLDWKSDV